MREWITRLSLFLLAWTAAPSNGLAQPARFAEVTADAGIFHHHGSPGLLGLEWMMAGAAAGDFDNDGWMDLFALGGGLQPDSLYINNRDGTFTDRAQQWQLGSPHIGSGVAAGDYNGDGWLDLFVTSLGDPDNPTVGQHRLYRNNGDSTFTNVAQEAGVHTSSPQFADGFGAAFGDYDLDGDLDLYIAGWLGGGAAPSLGNRLFENNGDGTFSDVSQAAGVLVSDAHGFTPCFADMDGDRFPELLLAADFFTSHYFLNNGDRTFSDVTAASGTSRESNGMGSTVGDFDNDGRPDWYVTSIFQPAGQQSSGNKLYYNQGGHVFTEMSAVAGVDHGGWGWGTVAVDVNHDGWLDIVETNAAGVSSTDLSRLWINDADRTFTETALPAGFVHDLDGRGLLSFDYDNDGDQDLVITTQRGPLRLYRNDVAGDATANWLRMFLDTSTQPGLAPFGLGAQVTATVGDRRYHRFLNGCAGYLTQSELSVHLGLGEAEAIDELRIDWANGDTTIIADVVANQILTLQPMTTPVTVAIDGRPSGARFAHTSPFLDLSGTAGASVPRPGGAPVSPIVSVAWSSDRGGSGTAMGTTKWSIRNIPLQPGTNTITVAASDSTGVTGTATITVAVDQLLYYLAEGATGSFFDFDILLGNPNAVAAPVTLTFLTEDGSTVVESHTLLPYSQRTFRVNEIAGLADTAVATVVSSDAALPLSVERSMFWNASVSAATSTDGPALASGATYYGSHTAAAVDSPRTRWLFAEGAQGFFDTFLLLANPNATDTAATITYLVEDSAPVVQHVTVRATSRLTLFAGALPALAAGTSFGIVVTSALPIVAERAMYFSAGRFWEGGHESAGVPEASTSWFHAEGATGPFFDTFLLVSNPNAVVANLTVTYLLGTSTAVVRTYGVPANGRSTINVETEDPQLANAAVSMAVTSDVPVISERAMYWPGGDTTWHASHNAFGVTATGTTWGFAEGRVGAPLDCETYLLLANFSATTADVQITYLRTDGPVVVKTYTVPPMSRVDVWVNGMVPELTDESFGALIEVTNGVAIAVERALYWNDGAGLWDGGTSETAVRLP